MEVPGSNRGKDKIYWSTSASIRANQPFLVSYINRRPASFPVSCNGSFPEEPSIKVEEISCTIWSNGKTQVQSAQRQSPPCSTVEYPGQEKNDGMLNSSQETFPSTLIVSDCSLEKVSSPLNCIENDSKCIPASMPSTGIVVNRPRSRRLNCFSISSKKVQDCFHSHRNAGKQKKSKFPAKFLFCFHSRAPNASSAACNPSLKCRKS